MSKERVLYHKLVTPENGILSRMKLTLPGKFRLIGSLALAFFAASLSAAPWPDHFPIGIYGVDNPAAVRAVAAGGFTTVFSPARKDLLNEANELGLKVIATPGTSAHAAAPDLKTLRNTIRQFDQHPALWAWYICDEPDLNAIPPSRVIEFERSLKKTGARKPSVLVLSSGAEPDYARITDFLMVDRYPINWMPLEHFGQHVKMARLSGGAEKPLFPVIQAFSWRNYPDMLGTARTNSLRAPTMQELRCMIYLALGEKIEGLFFYTYKDSRWDMAHEATAWNNLTNAVTEIHQRLPLFTAQQPWWSFDHEFSPEPAGWNEALLPAISPRLLKVTQGNRNIPSGYYVLAVNSSTNALDYRLRLHRSTDAIIPVLGNGSGVRLQNHWISDKFRPHEVKVYGPINWLEEDPKPSKPPRRASPLLKNQR